MALLDLQMIFRHQLKGRRYKRKYHGHGKYYFLKNKEDGSFVHQFLLLPQVPYKLQHVLMNRYQV